MAIVFEDAAQDYTRLCPNYAACEATATNGNVWASVGFTTASDFWVSLGSPDDPSQGATNPVNTFFGNFLLGVNFIQNNTGYQWNQVACNNPFFPGFVLVDACGQGGMFASGRLFNNPNTPYDVWDNADFTMNRAPEPASAALLGLGLLGMGVGRMRRKGN